MDTCLKIENFGGRSASPTSLLLARIVKVQQKNRGGNVDLTSVQCVDVAGRLVQSELSAAGRIAHGA